MEPLSNVSASMHFPFRRTFLLSLYDFETLICISQKPIGNNWGYSMLNKKYLRFSSEHDSVQFFCCCFFKGHSNHMKEFMKNAYCQFTYCLVKLNSELFGIDDT